jgi:hypothetical protein
MTEYLTGPRRLTPRFDVDPQPCSARRGWLHCRELHERGSTRVVPGRTQAVFVRFDQNSNYCNNQLAGSIEGILLDLVDIVRIMQQTHLTG